MSASAHDTRIGQLPIAPLEIAFVDVRGLVWGGRLFDNSIGRDLAPVLASGVLGASFGFAVLDEEWEAPSRASDNAERLPSRTIRDLAIFELGPVVWAAYPTSAAGTGAPPRSKWQAVGRDKFVTSLRTTRYGWRRRITGNRMCVEVRG